jgi:hypothetical protein
MLFAAALISVALGTFFVVAGDRRE